LGRHLRLGFACAIATLAVSLAVVPAALADGVPFQKGDVLAGMGDGTIGHFSPSGTLLDTLDTTSGSNEDTGMCFDSDGNLYTTNFEANTMSKFDKNGNLVAASFGSGFNQNPESCAFNSSNQMYVGQADGSTQVLEFDTSGNLLNTFSPAGESRGTDWIDLAADEKTLHYTSEGSLVKQFDVSTNTQGPDFATGLPAPCYAHRILADGGELVACSSEVVRLDSSGAQVQTYPVDSNNNLFALNVDPDGTSFWTADFNGMIFHVDIASGNVIGSFDAHPTVDVAGLAVVGEQTVAQDPAITATGTPVSATEGQSFTGTVATFTDPDTSATASEYSATIDWGDGSTSTGTISGSGGNFTVTGTHTYAEEGTNTITVTITDVDNTANTATATSTATIADAPLTATGTTVSAVEGASTTPTVATFTDADPAGTVSDYTATIDWGDGSTTTGTIAASAPGFSVSGTHTYAEEGTYTITVTIKDVGGATATAQSTAKVADAALHATGVSKTTPRSFSGTIATFTDADPAGTVSDYTATISWGDGSTSSGGISTGFKVSGNHKYAKTGVYHVSITIKDHGGSTTTTTSTLTVKVKLALVAGLRITHVSASPLKPGCDTELAVIADASCSFGKMTIKGTVNKKARGKVHVTVFVPLLSGPVSGTARIVRGHWRLTLKVAGINRDNPEPVYRIAAKFNGSPGVRKGHAQKRVTYESEPAGQGPA
jgi:streptogramin lyase/PKD repeat protein